MEYEKLASTMFMLTCI